MRGLLGLGLLGLLLGIVDCQTVQVGSFPSNSAHKVSGTVFVLSDNQIKIIGFSYDGQGPDAYFYIGKKGTSGASPDSTGIIIPDEMGSKDVLMKYDNVDITLELEPGTTTKDILWLSVWCELFSVDFGHVKFPANLVSPTGTPPPSTMYYGEAVGSLVTKYHDVSGEIYIVDENRIQIVDFNYNGGGPDAYFYVGKKGEHGTSPQGGALIVPNEKGSSSKLEEYVNKNVVLTLPDGVKVTDIAWFSIWCLSVGVDFGSLVFPGTFPTIPATFNLGVINGLASGVSSGDVVILDKKTLRINNFNYDGKGPDAFFFVGAGTPGPQGTKLPDEKGSYEKLGKYEDVTVMLMLPGGVTVDDIDYLSIYCYSQTINFGHVTLPSSAYLVPPYIPPPPLEALTNCQAMNEDFNVAWQIDGSNIIFEFIGALDGDTGYMAFGISGSTTKSDMIGADPMVVYLDNGSPRIADYTINERSYCSGTTGVCLDTSQSGGVNDLTLIDADFTDGVTRVHFSRELRASDSFDKAIQATGKQYVIWATGKVNDDKLVTRHTGRLTEDLQIDFSKTVATCKEIKGKDQEEIKPWAPAILSGKDTQTFTAQLGPSGGDRGYTAITGSQSWGIAWYINGYLIPEIILRRGDTYTFKVEGGDNPILNAKYHPLYITDDPTGGYADKTDKTGLKLIAGTITNANGTFATVGRYCEFETDANEKEHETFESYKDTLELKCDPGETGSFTWTPDADTPDEVYYQCFTHSYLGWKIHVRDEFPVSGSPVSGSPVSGSPVSVSGSPVSGSPVSGSPVSGSPMSGSECLRFQYFTVGIMIIFYSFNSLFETD